MEWDGKMRGSAEYMQAHICENITVGQLAKRCSYTEPYFSRLFSAYFGMPPARFLMGMRLRRAMEEIRAGEPITVVAKRYGFASLQSFSKAVKREFGLSPRAWKLSGRPVPDMPSKKTIRGHGLTVRYERTRPFWAGGEIFPPRDWESLDLLGDIADGLLSGRVNFRPGDGREYAMMWWNDQAYRIVYYFGEVYGREEDIPEGKLSVAVPGADYAVFTTEWSEDKEELAQTMKALAAYVYGEWVVVNHKTVNMMGFVFQRYGKEGASFYLPLIRHENGGSANMFSGEYMISQTGQWASFIDAHITDSMAEEEIAAHFHYSLQHFRDVFRLYYDVPLGTYIRRKRLCLAAEELASGHTVEMISSKYHFSSVEAFRKAFRNTFHMSPSQLNPESLTAVDLLAYYSHNRDSLKVDTEYRASFQVIGMTLPASRKGRDISRQAASMFGRDLFETVRKNEDKYALWHSPAGAVNLDYIVGVEVERFESAPAGVKKVLLEGGKYAVFQTREKSDCGDLAETFRKMCRCALYGWINENWGQVDFRRLTFMRFSGQKLYTYVPIY